MDSLIIAAAQSISIRGDVQENLETHCRLVELASEQHAQVVVFPELSLTGYELDLANELAFSANDQRLNSLQKLAVKNKIIIVAGAPVRLETGLHIGAFILSPDNSVKIYTKRYLHPGEEKFFNPSTLNPIMSIGGEVAALAICADTNNPRHPRDAANQGAKLYLAGVLFSTKGYTADAAMLHKYAQQYGIVVLLANHGGASGGYDSAGRSAIWSPTGDLLAEFNGTGEGIVLATEEENRWRGSIITKQTKV